MRRFLVCLLGVALVACGGSGSSSSNSNASPLQLQSQSLASTVVAIAAGVQQALPAFLVPALATAKGITITPGTTANSYDFHATVDADGDGTNETIVDGSVQLNGSLFSFGPGFGGTVSVTLSLGNGRSMSANLEFEMVANGGIQVSGSGSFTDSNTITDIAFEIDPLAPLTVRVVRNSPIVAGEGSGTAANLCEYSADGPVRVRTYVEGQIYRALWTFHQNQVPIQVTEAALLGENEEEIPQPDTSFIVGCPSASIQDWAGTYDFNWFCNPEEEGQEVMVITVTGPNTIHISVDDGLEYDATVVPGNPHVVQGFFIDPGFYREDFVWTLSRDSKSFTQQSVYRNLPPATGGGVCGGIGVKRP